MRRLKRRARDGERGAELIELAIVLPILLVVCAAIVDFGMLFQRYEVITNAAREGARIGVLPSYTQTDVTSRVNDYLNASGLSSALATVTVSYNGAMPITGSSNTVSVVNVLVQYPTEFTALGPLVGLIGGGGFSTMNLRAGSNMRVEAGGGAGS